MESFGRKPSERYEETATTLPAKSAFLEVWHLSRRLPTVHNFHDIAINGEGFVIMWRHGEQYPRLHISSVPLAAFWRGDFDPTQWTICLYWEPSDASQPDEPSPMVEEPPDRNDGAPQYSDPNVPIHPPPGLAQPDESMPPQDDEMPPVQNTPQPPGDPPP